MFQITVFLGETIAPVVLLYKGKDTALEAIKGLEELNSMPLRNADATYSFRIDDDFGQQLNLWNRPIGVLTQDLKQAQEADIIRGVHQAVTQAKAQDRAKEDPVLKEHFRRQQSPAVFSPMGGQVGGPRFNG